MISFLTAFGLEALLHGKLWAQLSTGFLFGATVLLILWCASAILENEARFNVLDGVQVLKDGLVGFARSFRGTASEPGPGAEHARDGDGQGRSGVLSRPGTLMKAFNRLQRLRRPRASTPPVPVDRTGGNRHSSPGAIAAEMGEVTNDALRGAV